MDPTALALLMGLQQAPPAASPSIGSSGRQHSGEMPMLDRSPEQPLFMLGGQPVRVDLTAGAWLARLRGEVAFGPLGTARVDLNDTYGLDSLQGAFQGDLSLICRNWTLRLTGSTFGTDATQSAPDAGAFGNTAYAAGDTLQSSFDFYSWGVDVQSWVWRPLSAQQFPWDAPVSGEDLGGDLQILAIVGGRGFGIRQQVQNITAGGSSTYDQSFGTIIVGGGVDVRVDLKDRVGFLDHLQVMASGTWGPSWPGSQGSYVEVRVGLTAWITRNLGVLFGYRYTDMDFTQGDYRFSGNVAGLMVGGSLRF
jgi:hypothetical protein